MRVAIKGLAKKNDKNLNRNVTIRKLKFLSYYFQLLKRLYSSLWNYYLLGK